MYKVSTVSSLFSAALVMHIQSYAATSFITLHASCSAVYCNRSCLWVWGCVCYHDISKLHTLIFTKLGL